MISVALLTYQVLALAPLDGRNFCVFYRQFVVNGLLTWTYPAVVFALVIALEARVRVKGV